VPEPEAERITVQHILIAFKGSLKAPPNVTRTREEAEKFANELLEQVRKGGDIAKLAAEHSTDPGGGRYTLVNSGVVPMPGEIKRSVFIKPFVDVAFKLKVGGAGLVEYDPKDAPFGWHVIKRLE
jgi:peptidyl-prolyl cis-trans isomerase D